MKQNNTNSDNQFEGKSEVSGIPGAPASSMTTKIWIPASERKRGASSAQSAPQPEQPVQQPQTELQRRHVQPHPTGAQSNQAQQNQTAQQRRRRRQQPQQPTEPPRYAEQETVRTPIERTPIERTPIAAGTEQPTVFEESKPEVTIKEKIKEDIRARKKRVFIIPIVVLSVLFIAVFSVLAVQYMARVNLGAVQNTHVHEITSFSITLAWDPVFGAEGYHIYQKKPNSEEYQQIDATENTYFIVYGLSQAEQYSFFVKAYYGSNESKEYTPVEGIYTNLDKGFINDMYSSESGVIHVGWAANDRADGYYLEFRTMGKDYRPENQILLERTDSTEYNITALSPNVSIGVRISAFYDRGDERIMGEPSDERAVRVSDGTMDNMPRMATKPMVALTFDDGPLAGDSGERILDVLERYGAKATFFMVGTGVEAYPENVKRKAALGMELGNHSYDHETYGDELPLSDIAACSDAIENVCGMRPTAFRSPGGITTGEILQECQNEGLAAYNWSVDTLDWDTRDADAVVREIQQNVQDGDIILLHEIYDSTADAIERIVPWLIDQGYDLVTCSELVRAKTGAEPILNYEYHDMR